jgi:hypothetical protein
MTYHRWAEIAAEKQTPFMPHQGLATLDLFLYTMLDRRTDETCMIDCTESLGNIYENGSRTCRPNGKNNKDAQLWELIHSITIEHTSEHEVVCGSKSEWEKRGEGETTAEWQPPRASGCEAAMSSRGWWLGVAKTPLQEKHQVPLPDTPNVKVVYDTSTGIITRAARFGSLLEGLRL